MDSLFCFSLSLIINWKKFPTEVECSHPAFVFAALEAVASIRDTSIGDVLLYNRRNVKRVYGF